MRTVSTRFLAEMRASHIVASSCELLFPGSSTWTSVPVEAGQVIIDRTAQHRRSGHVQIPWSLQQGEDLGLDLRTLPLGGYARLKRGVRYADGSLELVTLGVLRVESVTWATLSGTASLELADRMAQVRDQPFTSPYAAGGQRPADAAIAIVQAVFGGAITYSKPFDPAITLSDVFYTGDRGEAISALEQAANAETWFDADGNFVFAAKPAASDPIVWTVDTGQAGVMVDASEHLDRTGIYNGVYVTGQANGTDPPVTALATYTDPSSPIRWGGPFGSVALLADSTSVQDATQAQSVASSLLNLRLQQTRSLTLTAAPNPALEAGDTIRVVFSDGRVEQHLIDAVTTSLSTEAQQIITRSKFTPQSLTLLVPPPEHARFVAGLARWGAGS